VTGRPARPAGGAPTGASPGGAAASAAGGLPGITAAARRPWAALGRLLRPSLGLAGTVPLLALVAVMVALVAKALPAMRYNGFGFLGRSRWDVGGLYASPIVTHGVRHPPGASYGALPLVVGTIESSVIALVIAVPVAVGLALVVVHRLPPRASTIVGAGLEVLAGIPSVVIGLWGALTLGPFIAHDITPDIAAAMPDVPVLDFFRGPVGAGQGLLTSGVVLAVMILPIVAATTRDLLRQVPRDTIDGAVALGMTDAEALRAVSFPWVNAGIVGASVLGLGRALGETMAVAMVSGAVLGTLPRNLYEAMGTIAATIVSQLDSALTDASGLAVSTLAELGLVLIVITLVVNIGARLLVRRVTGTALPVGRGI
jgi:phosphate transport system permease protein